MTLYTDGTIPATDAEIESEAGRIRKRRQKVERGGRKPALSPEQQERALMMLDMGVFSINLIAQSFGVSWSTIKRVKDRKPGRPRGIEKR